MSNGKEIEFLIALFQKQKMVFHSSFNNVRVVRCNEKRMTIAVSSYFGEKTIDIKTNEIGDTVFLNKEHYDQGFKSKEEYIDWLLTIYQKNGESDSLECIKYESFLCSDCNKEVNENQIIKIISPSEEKMICKRCFAKYYETCTLCEMPYNKLSSEREEKLCISCKKIVDNYLLNGVAENKQIIEKYFEKIEKTKIAEIIERRNIKYLAHFTQVDNLYSILEEGILPRNTIDEKGIDYMYNDFDRRDGRKDCSCFSIERPNNYMRRSVDKEKGNRNWCVLLIDAKVIIDHEAFFFTTNASRTDRIRNEAYWKDHKTAASFEAMFAEEVEGQGLYRRKEKTGMLDYETTDEQAEILIKGIIERKSIKRIVFQNNGALSKFKKEHEKYSSSKKLIVNESLFKTRYEIMNNYGGNSWQ